MGKVMYVRSCRVLWPVPSRTACLSDPSLQPLENGDSVDCKYTGWLWEATGIGKVCSAMLIGLLVRACLYSCHILPFLPLHFYLPFAPFHLPTSPFSPHLPFSLPPLPSSPLHLSSSSHFPPFLSSFLLPSHLKCCRFLTAMLPLTSHSSSRLARAKLLR